MKTPSRPGTPQNSVANTGGQYFDRRGEVTELKQLLREALSNRDSSKMGEAIRKVIGYMTLGIDMSRIFSEMVMASQVGDIVQKKMIYLYLTAYAEQNAELAILAVNTLQKDTKDVDPSIRGLALRSLCSLRLSNIVEYLEPAIESGLGDSSGYVRKTAVMGVLKLGNSLAYVDRLFAMIESDSDVCVVSNSLVVLKEMDALTDLSQNFVYALLNKFPLFSEWSRCVVIDNVLSQYTPDSSDELFDLMNCLDPYLKQSSIPVSIGIMRLFLNWAETSDSLTRNDIIERIADPILTLLSSSSQSVEMQYAILAEIISFGNLEIFEKNYKIFLLTDYDSIETGKLKINILSHFNHPEVLARYIADPVMGEFAIDALVHMAKKSGDLRIFDLLAANNSNCLVGLAKLLALFPTEFPRVAHKFEQVSLSNKKSLSSIVWILGRFGQFIDDAPYLLEQVDYEDDPELQMGLLSAAFRLFFVRPAETRDLLEKVITEGIDLCMHPDLHDRALFYYRMLKFGGIETAQRMVTHEESSTQSADTFLENSQMINADSHVEDILLI